MIEPAYVRLGQLLAQALVATDFIAATTALKIDPTAPFAPTGNERQLVRAAALVVVKTEPVRTLLGRPQPRYVVERGARLELALAGPAKDLRKQISDDTLNALAVLPGLNPTLDGMAERFLLGAQTDDELPPNGISIFIDFTIRVRSGDPLGRTA